MRFLLALLVIGGMLVYFGVQEMRLASGAQAQAHSISCDQLGKQGPGDNAHVIMTDFLLSPAGYVYESKKEGGDYQRVWIPAVPVEGEYHQKLKSLVNAMGQLSDDLPAPTDIRVIVKTSHIKDQAQLGAAFDWETIEGMVINKIEGLSGDERKLLAESYPGVDFNKVWILEHDRQPAGMAKVAGMTGGGAALILAAAGLFIKSRKSNA